MYRQRKRDLNLKPNRQLDKRSSRGMIYENEELRMRTIAICDDVDRGQSDIKKLRSENHYLKKEIWGLRDECDKLEKMLKKVCISANIPEIQLDSPSNNDEEDYDEDDGDGDDDDDNGSNNDEDVPPDKFLSAEEASRERRESGTSVGTFDSEVGSYISNMFGDGTEQQQEEIPFAIDDPGSVILNPEEPMPSTSAGVFQNQHVSWSPHHAAVPPDLEMVREESESNLTSPATPLPPQLNLQLGINFDDENITLPDPSMVVLPSAFDAEVQGTEGRKTPVIHITPASSPTSNSNSTGDTNSPDRENLNSEDLINLEDEIVQDGGCITVIPKTFKVTSEIVVGNGDASDAKKSLNKDLPPKGPHQPKPYAYATDKIGLASGMGQRRSCYFPAGTTPLPSSHRNVGILGYCCCNNDLILGGYQSEPSLVSNEATPSGDEVSSPVHSSATSFFNSFCCRVPPPNFVPVPTTLRSVWNTVDKNIVIGFYGYSTGTGSGGGESSQDLMIDPKVQDIIDELEAQFDPTLENILGVRLISPGRIFISLKNASVVKAFLQRFKTDLILKNKQNPNQRVRIHFIEGTTTKLTTTLVLSGIPQELSDLAVISALNQFGQVVAPLEKRNYKGIDISERIAKMHLVTPESSMPDIINISGYEVRIGAEQKGEKEVDSSINKLTHGQQVGSEELHTSAPPPPSLVLKQPQRKYGFIHPGPPQIMGTTAGPSVAQAPPPLQSALKPHKPVTRSSSSAPRLETPAPGTLTCPLPPVEHKRHNSVCVGNIPTDQHPSNLITTSNQQASQPQQQPQQKVTIAQHQQQGQTSSSNPNLIPPKKPLARLLNSSPGSFTPSPVNSPPGSPVDNMTVHKTGSQKDGGPLKAFCRSFDPRRPSENRGHPSLSPSSSYSPRSRRKSSVQFAKLGKGKREPLPWCGCWGLGCGQ